MGCAPSTDEPLTAVLATPNRCCVAGMSPTSLTARVILALDNISHICHMISLLAVVVHMVRHHKTASTAPSNRATKISSAWRFTAAPTHGLETQPIRQHFCLGTVRKSIQAPPAQSSSIAEATMSQTTLSGTNCPLSMNCVPVPSSSFLKVLPKISPVDMGNRRLTDGSGLCSFAAPGVQTK